VAYIRAKKIKRSARRPKYHSYWADAEEYTYYQLVEGYRDESGKVKQRVVAHLGREAEPDKAVAHWERRAQWHRDRAADLRHAARHMRDRSMENTRSDRHRRFKRTNHGRGKWFVPKAGTPVPDVPPTPTYLAPPGWFYFAGNTPEDAEREAQESLEQAEVFQQRAERIRAAL